ncbi:MAG: MEKHLA domain-containing protein [Rhodocyclaceae bacterium]|nr:MEKHLA domain-containing protein [Rhodocyclaceae bacterium]
MSCDVPEPHDDNRHQADHALCLLRNYRRLTGRDLLPSSWAPAVAARELYHAPFVVLSHDAAADPLFTYANLAAQRAFEMPWRDIVGMPSRHSAEPLARAERQRLLERVADHGYIDDYEGVRISRSGKRFQVSNATVWNVSDADGLIIGQAATFAAWQPVD